MDKNNAKGPPCIGLLVIDLSHSLIRRYGHQFQNYIPASYVKYLESAGALVVPIWSGRKRFYYRHMMSQINGILLPGGGVPLSNNDSVLTNYMESAYHIFDLVLELNQAGKYFPLWGTSLGFQLLMMHAAKSWDIRTECTQVKDALPLLLEKDFRKSKLLKQLPEHLSNQLANIPFACHNHEYCIPREKLDDFMISKDWHILATLCDDSAKDFITLIEHRCWPLFGCQFHPERVAYDQLLLKENPWKMAHCQICIEMSQYLANTFVEICRHNTNSFPSTEQISRHRIWNWQLIYTGKVKRLSWIEIYVFEENANYHIDKTAKRSMECKK